MSIHIMRALCTAGAGVAVIASGFAGASAAGTVRTAPAGTVASFSTPGSFNGVAVLSARSAWAVGSAGSKTLIVRWNGTVWKRVPSPVQASGDFAAVAATSAHSAWAVGTTRFGAKTLIVRWNGTTWKRVPSPAPAPENFLSGVAATSAGSALAVGYTGGKTLILRWNGTVWRRVPSPTPAGGGILTGVAANRRPAPGRSAAQAATR